MKTYKRNGKDCYLCLSRKRLVCVLPEETVRQNFIKELVEKYNVPISQIKAEEALAHHKKGQKGRADIVVFYNNSPLILIECKEANHFLTHKTLEQVQKYNTILKAEIYGITNGTDTYWYLKNHQLISFLPTYEKILKNSNFEILSLEQILGYDPFKRISKLENELKEDGIMGEETPTNLASFIANLYNLFVEEINKFILPHGKNYEFILDGGIRPAAYSNSSGGTWDGYYRYLMLRDSNLDSQIISFAVMGCANGTTMLIVAYDEGEESHNSLQLSIDKFAKSDKKIFEIWHDGRITVGSLGPSPREQMIKFVEKKCPHLVKNGIIKLGVLDNSKSFQPNSPDIQSFIKNIIDYIFCREEFRREVKERALK